MGPRIIACSLLMVCAVGYAGCSRDAAPPPPDPAIAEAAAPPIHFDQAFGADRQLTGLSVEASPDRRSWVITVYSTVVHKQSPRPQIWLHAYPKGSQEYFIVDPNPNPSGGAPPADAGRVLKDAFLLKKSGAFNLYAGIMGADGSYGPAVSLGWVGVGDPDTKEYHETYKFLKEANDARAATMLEQTRRTYPKATLP